ncbi:MAG: SpoIID/LytB domain-containing protein [Cyanothece sp. SIO1E1]|nr:SpoIID/LytB domain-containing protein [Cyanothece sp. SIO1E1]
MPTTLVTVSWVGVMIEPVGAQTGKEPELKIGIVQRFGSELDDQMTIRALRGDRLTLRFKTGGKPQQITATEIKVEVVSQPLSQPQLKERVVLSTHRSFESAEDSANQWRQRGIETEIAQPEQWQVWADRDVYDVPLVRRLLLRNLQSKGFDTVVLDSQVQQEVPKLAFIANGYRYHRDQVDISSNNRRIRVLLGASQRNSKLYGGNMQLQPNAYGTYTLVNQVPIETYLRGVVPHEIGSGAPPTTAQAQAILARTYVLRNLRRFVIDDYELCADTQCQVYWGLGGATPEADAAIANTRGLVLTYENELVDALYSSTTGGITAPFSDVWNGPNRPYLKAVVDSVQNVWNLSNQSLADEQNFRAFISQNQGFNEVGWRWFRWRTQSSLEVITADLKEYLQNRQHPLANFNTVQQLQVSERSAAGRVQKLSVQTDQGELVLEKDEVIRAISAPNSLLFYIDPIYEQPQQSTPLPADASAGTPEGTENQTPTQPPQPIPRGYIFVGGGLGHGVGMSQTGAYRLGNLGWSSDRILSFYYPGTQLQPINDNIVFWRDPFSTSAMPEASKAPEPVPLAQP